MKRNSKVGWSAALLLFGALLAAAAFSAPLAAASTPEIVNGEGKEVVHKHFTGGETLNASFANSAEEFLKCELSGNAGEVTGSKSLKMTITFKLCSVSAALGGGYCASAGHASGVVVTNVVGKPVFLDEKHTEVGLALEPEVKNGAFVQCTTEGGIPVKVGVHEAEKGGLDTVLASVYKNGEILKELEFSCASAGRQQWRSFWEGAGSIQAYLEANPTILGKWTEVCFNNGRHPVTFEEGVSFSAGAPIVTTTAAGPVAGKTATVNGTVNPHGRATTYFFEYASEKGAWHDTSEFSAGEGSTAVPESVGLTGLEVGEVYRYKIFAKNAGGTATGAESKFTAGPALAPAKGTFPVAFSSAGAEALVLQGGTEKIECKHEAGTGSFVAAKEAKVTIKWTECTVLAGGVHVNCGKAGEITTKELKGVTAYTLPAKTGAEGRETGLVLSAASGEVITEFTCGGLVSYVVKGSAVGVLTPLKSLTKAVTATFKQAGSTQTPSEYQAENGTKVSSSLSCTLNGGAPGKCALEGASTLTFTGEEALIEA